MQLIKIFLFSLISLQLGAQTSGEIIYEVTTDVHRKLTGDRERFKEFIPQYNTQKMILLFDDHQATYKAPENDVEEVLTPEDSRRRRMQRRMAGAGVGNLWQDYKENKRIEERDFLDKKFLIVGEPHTYKWKLTGESMQVGQYLCQKATYEDSTTNVLAWFTPTVPVPLGPGEYGQLPGLILHIDVNEGESVMTAQEINLREVDSSLITEPKKGKKVTNEEFEAIMKAKREEMRAQNGDRPPGGPGRPGRP